MYGGTRVKTATAVDGKQTELSLGAARPDHISIQETARGVSGVHKGEGASRPDSPSNTWRRSTVSAVSDWRGKGAGGKISGKFIYFVEEW